jgi:hypothetical protein
VSGELIVAQEDLFPPHHKHTEKKEEEKAKRNQPTNAEKTTTTTAHERRENVPAEKEKGRNDRMEIVKRLKKNKKEANGTVVVAASLAIGSRLFHSSDLYVTRPQNVLRSFAPGAHGSCDTGGTHYYSA